MTTLNKSAADVIRDGGFDVHALTDVTGFGLVGHAYEKAAASNVKLRLHSRALPVLEGALEAISIGCIPGGACANSEFLRSKVNYCSDVTKEARALVTDPQTSGGLLAALEAKDSKRFIAELKLRHVFATEIGEVVDVKRDSIAVEVC